MMNKLVKKGILFFLCLITFFAGIGAGMFLYKAQNLKTVAFRVSNNQEEMDYDFVAALDYLEYRFKENGYRLLGINYSGDLYSEKTDNAYVNVYVRGFRNFHDLRRKDDALNVYYIHRMMETYVEEFRGYDYYLSSQKNIKENLKNDLDLSLLEGGAVPHERLKESYDKDVLYIYEYGNPFFVTFLKENLQANIYGGRAFVALSEADRKKELAGARLVVYDMGDPKRDDADYVPYAVYDIISYGRPVMTNYKKPLDEAFGDNVYLFKERDKMSDVTTKALSITDSERERRAQAVREKLLSRENKNSFFLKK